MNEIEISDATAPLADYARAAETNRPVILTRKGKPVAAIVSLKGVDRETLSLSQNPRFLAILEASRASYRAEGGISSDEMRRRLGIPAKRRKRRTR